VIQYRLLQEYGAACSFKTLPFYKACWIQGDATKVADFVRYKQANVVNDKEDNLVYLAESEWYLNTERANNPAIKFFITNDYKHELA
jgi:peptide chain release factor 3